MIKKIMLTKEQINEMKKHIITNRPHEACGLIIGSIKNTTAVGEEILKMKNVRHSKVEFYMDPTELYNAYMYAEEKGKEIVSIFHSHPGGTNPSNHDLKNMRLNPYVWIIFDMYKLTYEAFYFSIEKEKIFPVEIIEIS